MPPRRSSRAPSAKPTSKPPSKAEDKPALRKPASKKRAASPERSTSPPPKRTRTKGEEQNIAPRSSKPSSKTAAQKSSQTQAKTTRTKLAAIPEGSDTKAEPVRKAKAPAVQTKPYLNPLPTPPEKQRPGLQLFVWGAGNFGQFGLGPDVLDELDKPKKHVWAEQQMQNGSFGEEGAGLEAIAGGGMHSLFVDEKGTVS